MRIRFLRANQIVITDNRTPACLPGWARDELVDQRLAISHAVEALMKDDVCTALVALGYHDLIEFYYSLYPEERGS